MVRLVRDVTGILCGLFTYICLIFGVYGTWKFCLQYYPSDIYFYINGSFILFGSVLAFYSHILCVFTNPGLLTKIGEKEITKIVRSTQFVGPETFHTGITQQGVFAIPDIDDIRLCGRCLSIRSTYTHHCRECDGCIFRMDHHCPWINNCVGVLNQKYFLQFCSYISFISFYSLVLTIIRFISLFYMPVISKNNITIHDPGYIIQITNIIHVYGIYELLVGWFLLLESICFGCFTLFLLIDQLHNIWISEGKIDRWKRQKEEKNRTSNNTTQHIQKTSEMKICSNSNENSNIKNKNNQNQKQQQEYFHNENEICFDNDNLLYKISDMVMGETFSFFHWIFPTSLPSSFFKKFSEYKKTLKSQLILLSQQLSEEQKTKFIEKMSQSAACHVHSE